MRRVCAILATISFGLLRAVLLWPPLAARFSRLRYFPYEEAPYKVEYQRWYDDSGDFEWFVLVKRRPLARTLGPAEYAPQESPDYGKWHEENRAWFVSMPRAELSMGVFPGIFRSTGPVWHIEGGRRVGDAFEISYFLIPEFLVVLFAILPSIWLLAWLWTHRQAIAQRFSRKSPSASV